MERIAVLALLALAASGVAAQQKPRPDPADPAARAAPDAYRSAFEGYRPFADAELARWREANEEMRRLGGHVGHVPGALPPRAAPDAKPPAHADHGGRK
jgi:hypothetical protein